MRIIVSNFGRYAHGSDGCGAFEANMLQSKLLRMGDAVIGYFKNAGKSVFLNFADTGGDGEELSGVG